VLKSTRTIAIATVCMSAVLLTGCSTTKTLNGTDVQNAISKGLVDQVGGGPYTVVCPTEPTAQKGATFTCDVTDPSDGTKAVVTVTQTDDNGTFDWKVTSASSGSPAPAPSAS
jgi:hypothetical protein